MTNTEVLIKARKLVAKKWIQGKSTDGNGGYCTVGAIHAFNNGEDCRSRADGPRAAFASAIGSTPDRMAEWNDNPARTQAQVLAAFDKAIGPRRRFLAWITGLFGVRQ